MNTLCKIFKYIFQFRKNFDSDLNFLIEIKINSNIIEIFDSMMFIGGG